MGQHCSCGAYSKFGSLNPKRHSKCAKRKDKLAQITDLLVNNYEKDYQYSDKEKGELLDRIVEIIDGH